MSLKKGFLRPVISLKELNLDRGKLIIGAIYWLILSFSIYAVLYIVREGLRFSTFWWNGEDFLVLSSTENYFYNFFFASLACIFSFTVISNHWLRRPSTLQHIRGYVRANIFHDKVSFSWYFIWWFTKLGLLFAFCTQMGTFLTFSLYPAYVPVLLLMILVVFLHQWLRLRLLFKDSIIPWMIGIYGISTITAFLFSAINILPYQQLNESILKQTIGYYIKQDIPVLNNGHLLRRNSLEPNIFFGPSKLNVDSLPIVIVRNFHDPVNEISLDQIHEFVRREIGRVDEYEKYRLKWCLSIDSSVKMKHVKKLKYELRRSYLQVINYVGLKHEDSSSRTQIGLGQALQNPESNYLEILDQVDGEVILRLNIKGNIIWVEGEKHPSENLNEIIKTFFKTNGRNGVILFEVDDESSFGFYIRTYDQIISSVKYLRDEWMMEKFKTHYIDPVFDEQSQSENNILARQQYPANILEIN